MLSYALRSKGFHLIFIAIIFALFVQIAMVCICGQKLTDAVCSLVGFFDYLIYNLFSCSKSRRFSESIYQLKWQNLHVREQKMLLLMFMKAQNEVSLTAGNIYPLNFQTWTQVSKLIHFEGHTGVYFCRLSSSKRPCLHS